MAEITTEILIESPPETVWSHLSDLGSHAEWMADAESIRFLTEQRSGVGTRMEVATKVGPLRTTDLMDVVAWEDGRRIVVRHRAWSPVPDRSPSSRKVRGVAGVIWHETLDLPWRLGGADRRVGRRPAAALGLGTEPASAQAARSSLAQSGAKTVSVRPATRNQETNMPLQSTGTAHWEGDLNSGTGTTSLESGAATGLPLTWNARTEEHGILTSPEELIAAAHASCFSMSLANGLAKKAIPRPTW